MSAYRLAAGQQLGTLRAFVILRSPRFARPNVRLNLPTGRHAGPPERPAAAMLDFPNTPKLHYRLQSTSTHARHPAGRRPNPPPRPTLRQVIYAIFGGGLRNLRGALRGQSLRAIFRQNPEELVIAVFILVVAAATAVYAVILYFTYFYHEQFTRYPDPIAKSLRRALYFSNYNPDNQRALRYYKTALEQCDEFGLDPFSDDVMGIKIQLAAWLEKIGNLSNATKVLEALLRDCKHWVEVMEKNVEGGTAPKLAASVSSTDQSTQATEGTDDQAPTPEMIWGRRTRILAKAIGISVKLGELYGDEHMLMNELAHERLTWAVETALGEVRRRSAEGLKEGEGDWMSAEAIGGALESLGHSYEKRLQFHLALPLFLQALQLCQDPCHISVLMNNLSASFAQLPAHVPLAAVGLSKEAPPGDASPEAIRNIYLQTARRWAKNAHSHAAQTQGEQRTAECDEACAVSLYNLGDIAAMFGNISEARRRYEQCMAMSDRIGYSRGYARAQEGLRGLEKTKA